MAQKHIGSKKACVLWCVWFALLMSAPYAPGTGSMATIGWGAVSTPRSLRMSPQGLSWACGGARCPASSA